MAFVTKLQITALVVQVSISTAAAVTAATDACTDMCKCISRAKKRLALYQSDLEQSQAMHLRNLLNYLKLQLAAKVETTNLKRKLAPVIAGAATVIEKCHNKLEPMAQATQKLTEGVEQLTRSWKLLKALKASNLKFRVTVGASGAFDAAPATNTLRDITDEPCPEAPDDEDDLKITAEVEAQQPKLPEQDYSMLTTAKCDRDGSSNSCHNQQVAQNSYWQIQMQAVQTVQVALSSPIPGTTTHSGVKTKAHKLTLAGD
uniref:Variant surface glycoprotein 1125.5721 n=1 Tax=Trypanosoma brucei TaxID=5691 RepID=A0A1J0RD96_9TRYP|nr:variant surface glycoprotein 1125.5721 [Trypanosoma brucei]